MAARSGRRWFWATLMLSSISIVAAVFAAWELLENRFFRDLDYLALHYLYVTRGIASSLILALWAAWFVLRERRQAEEELQRSREHYRGLLEASPAAVALYDASLCVAEWNAGAEELYGYSKAEVLGRELPTIPEQKREEHRSMLRQAAQGTSVEAETDRRAKDGSLVPVQVKLLAYHDPSPRDYFLEVTEDVRERVRLREKLIEIERLSSMGSMAAGTAHHLNSPLAAMLLRVQMMRDRSHEDGCGRDLASLEEGLKFCQHFVQRLLDFGRRAPAEKAPQQIASTVESIVNFMAPTLLARRAEVRLHLDGSQGSRVLADRNQLETLWLILLSNAADAVAPRGTIQVRVRRLGDGLVEVQVSDDGSGIETHDLPHVFEPFFTTKAPGRGTGLGLPIARNIVDEHGGSIRVESARQQGTTVWVRLPLCAGAIEEERP